MDELRIDRLVQVLKEVVAIGGQSETSRIAPNLEVIDATPPATLVPAGYIIIANEQGFYIPALEVPGVTYANGDLVNVLFIKGTEPIAMQQGSSSPSSNLWEIVPATTTDIYYDGGLVGINNPNPAYNLDVLGDIVVDTNVFYVDDVNDFIGMGTVVSTTSQQLSILMNDSKDILIDGTTNPRQIATGVMRFEQTPAISDTRCITYNVYANSQPNTHAVVVNMTATDIAVGETISAYDIVVNSANSTGGHVHGFEMSLAGAGAIEAHALHANPGIDPVHHLSGTFIAVEQGWQDDGGFVDTTAAFNGAPDIDIFVNNGAVCYWGMEDPFNQIEVVLNTVASGPGIKPVFEFSDGVGGWTVFPPIDDTQGFRQAGLISWIVATLLAAGWAQDTVNAVANKYWFRATRTQVALTTPPNEETLLVAASNEYRWDKDALVTIAKLGVGTSTVPHGGIGAAMLALEGANANIAGPHVQFTTPSDDYPLLQVLPWAHDAVSIQFDAYFDAAWRSSDATANFQIYKVGGKLKFKYDSGVAQGAVVTWNDGIVIGTDGNIGFQTSTLTQALTFGVSGSTIAMDTADASDNKALKIAGGGAAANTRGAFIELFGNEHAVDPGEVHIIPGGDAGMQVQIDSTIYVGDGNVGINVLVATERLHVAGNLYLEDDAIYWDNELPVQAKGIRMMPTATGGLDLGLITSQTSGEPIFRVLSTGLSERLRVEHDGVTSTTNVLQVTGAGVSYFVGSVGINDTVPDSLLVVNGEAYIGPAAVSGNTSNSKIGVAGLTIDHGTATGSETLSFKGSNVAHGMTAITETDTYLFFDSTQGIAGGWDTFALTEQALAIRMFGCSTTEITTTATNSAACIQFIANKKSGTARGPLGATGNTLTIANNTITSLIMKGNHNMHLNTTVTQNSFDEYDDAQLIRVFEIERGADNLVRSEFDKWLKYNRQDLVELDIATFEEDGAIFMNVNNLLKLHNGAIWQLHKKIEELRLANKRLEDKFLN